MKYLSRIVLLFLAFSGFGCSSNGGQDDGGNGDANGDAGDLPACLGDETDCTDTGILMQCNLGNWVPVECSVGEYCTDFGGTQKADCVEECGTSLDCPQGFYCDADSHCEQQGDCREDVGNPMCDATRTRVIMCEDETFQEVVIQECTPGVQYCDPLTASCRAFCTSDADCTAWPEESCNLSSGICERIHLCDSNAWCTSGADAPAWIRNRCAGGLCECTEGVCVIRPTEDASTAATMDVSCYPDAAVPPGVPATCNLAGVVISFVNAQPINYNQYIEVHLHTLSNILNGDGSSPIASATVTDDMGHSRYSLSDLPTNTELVMEVRCNDQGGAACTLHPLYTFVLYLRADDCQTEGGTLDVSAPAIDNSLWQAYSTAAGMVQADPNMGLAFSHIKDCAVGGGNAIIGGTGDFSMPYFQFGDHQGVFYIPFGGPPETDVSHTLQPGIFGAANVLPIRGFAAALIRDGFSLHWLRTYPLRVFPQAASLVLFEAPKIPR
jgi:hypothetical protein